MIRIRWFTYWGPAVLLLGLVVVCWPRFNLDTTGDQQQYIDVVQYLRGQTDFSTLSAPFAYRLAGPLLASLLPLEPMTALNIVNLLALGITALLIQRTILLLPRSLEAAFAGAALFVFSFPTFYYGTIGYVDPVLVLFLALFVFACCRQNHGLVATAFLLGCLAKESMLLTVPAYVAYVLLRPGHTRGRHLLRATAVIAAGATVVFAMRWLIPVGRDLSSAPSLQMVVANASRPRAWLSILLSMGIPGSLLGALLFLRIGRKQLFGHPVGLPLCLGALGSIILLAATYCAAYVDGRPVWMIYPFAVPMIALMWPTSEIEENAG